MARTVPLNSQPLKAAVALALIVLLTALLTLLGAVGLWVLDASGALEDMAWAQALFDGPDPASRIIVISLLGLVLMGLAFAVELTTLILSIIVMARGDGKLRLGAAILLATALGGLFFSASEDLPTRMSALTDALALIAFALQALEWCVTVAGGVVLTLGIREVRRARAALPPDLGV